MACEQAPSLLVLTFESAPRLLRRTAPPMLNDRLNPRGTLLDALRPLVAGSADHPRSRRDQHECADEVRMRCREEHGEGTALGDRDQRRLIRAGGLEHRANIVDLLLQGCGPGDPTRHPGPTPVELDQPRERGQPGQKARRGRQLPVELDVREPPWDDQDVERSFASQLIRELQIAVARVPGQDLHRAGILCTRESMAEGYTSSSWLSGTMTSTEPNPGSAPSTKNISTVMSGSTWACEMNATTFRPVSSWIVSL